MNKQRAGVIAVGLGVLLMGLLGLGAALAGAPVPMQPAADDEDTANVCRQYAPTPGPSPTAFITMTPPPPPPTGGSAAAPTPTRVRWRCAFIQPIFDLAPTPTFGPTLTPPPPP